MIGQQLRVNLRCQECSQDRTHRRRHLQKHADPNARKAFADVRRRSSRRSCDHGDQGNPDCIADIDVKAKRKQRHQHDSATKTGKGAEQSGNKEPRKSSPEKARRS